MKKETISLKDKIPAGKYMGGNVKETILHDPEWVDKNHPDTFILDYPAIKFLVNILFRKKYPHKGDH